MYFRCNSIHKTEETVRYISFFPHLFKLFDSWTANHHVGLFENVSSQDSILPLILLTEDISKKMLLSRFFFTILMSMYSPEMNEWEAIK